MKSIAWNNTAKLLPPDPYSGASITRLDGNVYYSEDPKCTPDGKRVCVIGWNSEKQEPACMVLDLETMRTAIVREPAGNAFNCGYSPHIYFWPGPGEPERTNTIERLNMETLEIEPVVTLKNPPIQPDVLLEGKPGRALMPFRDCSASASPGADFFIYVIFQPNTCWVVRADLKTGVCDKIFEHPEICNPHLKVEPAHGREIFIQHNRGSTIDEHGNCTVRCGKGGATHFLLSADGKKVTDLAIGEPHTCTSSGHSSWVGATGRVAVAVDWVHNDQMHPEKPADWTTDPRHPGTSLFTVGPGEAMPTPMIMPDHRVFHVSCSRCGKYFVCNSSPTRHGSTDIVVGNFKTGRYRTLVTRCWCRPGPQNITPCSLPMLTADMKYAIYRAKENPAIPDYGGYYLYAAEIPKAFLASLD